ncbi:conserved hypothetical protein [Trichormus variabilis ATCC 29413]|uniref:Uncharacterized protein n=2 Tax=Anabaena variabilis TaxID=264691 RepID=Q3MB84_TRIV2|nr:MULTISPECIES: hypothetical protein [Nostocaceae]ABA21752.1 conserved hypothetical protein [Trichormus variabilis ATCC 29413]MBC1216333.1 hypothetical protein [Trichormus variabilis ARAD]MBC1254962.1 hypothetical protein [Trichormus variabilis V5]MBC1268908.1 hypothetical protein [Trichormus variabilis FSR]MBC1304644.1 hypothetical protein [Trichormus variabilis N2B]
MQLPRIVLGCLAGLTTLVSIMEAKPVIASTTTLINENFSHIRNWKDLSTSISWGGHPVGTSAFQIFDIGGGNKAVGIADGTTHSAANILINGLSSNYTNLTGLKGFSALDWQFPQPINHATRVVTVEFRVKWMELSNTSSGEGGRFLVILNHNYPIGGLNLTPNSKYQDFSTPNIWAQPAYHARIRSGNNAASFAMLQYGGGMSASGEYEKFDANNDNIPDWWLPGFIQSAGGGVPGQGSPFPANSWSRSATGLASTNWQTFRYVVTPNTQELWRDANGSGNFTREAIMFLPQSSTAPFYQYFTQLSGLRLYWRAAGITKGQVLVDRLKVTVNTIP